MTTNYCKYLSFLFFVLILFAENIAAQNVDKTINKTNNGYLYLESLWINGPSYAVENKGDILFLGKGAYLKILNIADTSKIYEISSLYISSSILDIEYQDNLLFLACGTKGYYIVDIADLTNPQILVNQNYFDTALDLDVQENYLYIAAGKSDLRIIDISNPTKPNEVGSYTFEHSDPSNLIVVKDNVAFLAHTNPHDVYVLNITNQTNPQYVKRISIKDREYGPTLHWDHFISEIIINGNNLFLLGDIGKIDVFDISDLFNPVRINHLDYSEYRGANCAYFKNNLLYVCYRTGYMRVYDFSDIQNPIVIATYENSGEDLIVYNDIAYLACDDLGIKTLDVKNGNTKNISWNGTINDISEHNGFLWFATE